MNTSALLSGLRAVKRHWPGLAALVGAGAGCSSDRQTDASGKGFTQAAELIKTMKPSWGRKCQGTSILLFPALRNNERILCLLFKLDEIVP